MVRSLRARLVLTYAVIIAAMFCVVGTALVIYLVRNPVFYRNANIRLQAAETSIVRRSPALDNVSPDRLQSLARFEDDIFDVRVIILDASGQVTADSRPDPTLAIPATPLTRPAGASAARTLRDAAGNIWLYTRTAINSDYTLILALPRPRPQLRTILGDELIAVLIRAGLLAVGLAFLLAWAMGRWVSAPLQRLAGGLRAAAAGSYQAITPEGPDEVQDLARTYNAMARDLNSSRQAQQDFVANVSHELKTPLTSIQGFAQAIMEGVVSSPEALRQAASVIYDESGRMYRLVLGLLTLARLEGGPTPESPPSTGLIPLLEQCAAAMAPLAAQSGVAIELEVNELPPVRGSADQLEQVFHNLLDNAVKFSPAHGTVRVSGRKAGPMVEVSFCDQGPGIPASLQERVFERFFQIDPARRGGPGRGAGLGLAIARKIVQAYGGSIRVESQPGKGSTFTVSLPEGKVA